MSDFQWAMETACFASLRNGVLLGRDKQFSFGIIAFWTQHELANETVEKVLQLGGIVRTIDDESFILVIELSLSAQFASKIFGWIGCRTSDGLGDFSHVHDNSFDAVALALHLGRNARHFVTVENVRHIPIDVYRTHFDVGSLHVYDAVLLRITEYISINYFTSVWMCAPLMLMCVCASFSLSISFSLLLSRSRTLWSRCFSAPIDNNLEVSTCEIYMAAMRTPLHFRLLLLLVLLLIMMTEHVIVLFILIEQTAWVFGLMSTWWPLLDYTTIATMIRSNDIEYNFPNSHGKNASNGCLFCVYKPLLPLMHFIESLAICDGYELHCVFSFLRCKIFVVW